MRTNPIFQKIARFPSAIVRVWLRFRRLCFILLLFAVAGWGGWQWHQTSAYAWTDEEKQAYKSRQAQAVRFREDMFKNIIGTLDRRGAVFANPPSQQTTPRQLFWPKPEEKK